MGSTNRRAFLSWAGAAAASAALLPRHLAAQGGPGTPARLAADPQRPQFHLLPAKNWMNDPNGPIYFRGLYHMFFQYNPTAAIWGDMNWNHAVSPDMLHWTHLPLALSPTPDGPDSFGCFSGTTLGVGERVYAIYTGVRESSPELATLRDGKITVQESQCLAWSDDPKLRTWTKEPRPVLPLPPPGLAVTGFRDPSFWKQGDGYYMTVGSGVANRGGCVLIYHSADLRDWRYLHPLISGEWTGSKTANPCDDGEMWECPELFPLDGGHALIYSTQGKVFWVSGRLDEHTMTFVALKKGQLDLGAFYAPKTQLDAEGRRILWGWIQERRPESAMEAAGWSGMMSLPRQLTLDRGGRLRMQVLTRAASLRGRALETKGSEAELAVTLPQANGEVLCSGAKQTPLTFVVTAGGSELLRVVYLRETQTFVVDEHEVRLEADDTPMLHVFADASVLEITLSERIGYTKRFYLPGGTASDLNVVASGGKPIALSAWTITPISGNRLTTS